MTLTGQPPKSCPLTGARSIRGASSDGGRREHHAATWLSPQKSETLAQRNRASECNPGALRYDIVVKPANADWLQQPGWKNMTGHVKLATYLGISFIACFTGAHAQ